MKYHIITYGCQMNKSDSERITSVLGKMGYKPASKESGADLIVVNMCSVRQSAVNRVFGLNPKLSKLKIKNEKLKILLTGCILEADKKKFAKQFDLILDIKNLPSWPKILQKETNALIQPWHSYGGGFDLDVRPKYKNTKYENNFRAFVPISNGCNNFCSYCVVPFTRGPLICRNHQEILGEIKKLAKKGYKEIWLLGQNVNDYQSKVKSQKSKVKTATKNSKVINFAKLLKIIDNISGNFKFFFTSPHPKPSTRVKPRTRAKLGSGQSRTELRSSSGLGAGLVPHRNEVSGAGNFSWEELIDTLANCQKFGKYLNLPVQSGDDEILKKMNRNYTVKEYKNLVKRIRKTMPEIRLSTDVIVGFPGETKKQFGNTVKLFKEIKFINAYISKYSLRPGTTAFKLKDNVSLGEKKKREKILRNIITKNA